MIPTPSRPQAASLPQPGSSLANPRRIKIGSDGRPVLRTAPDSAG
jgi:hypothetical protein